MTDQPTPAVQDYLKAIHALGGAEHVVTPVAIAERLQVRAPSVTGMLKRLAEAGWIRYEARRGAELTEAGIAQARRVIRRHRLVELFLTRVLGLDWSEVDSEADALEHAISPRLEEALAKHLGVDGVRDETHEPSAAAQPSHQIGLGERLIPGVQVHVRAAAREGENLVRQGAGDQNRGGATRWGHRSLRQQVIEISEFMNA